MPRQTLSQRQDGRYKCKYKGRQFYGATQKEAFAKRDEYKRMLERGIKEEASGLPVSVYATRWVQTYKANLSDASYNAYVRILRHFCEHEGIGARSMQSIGAMDVQDFYNQYQGKSKSTISKVRNTIRAMFRSALADRVILYDPTFNATPPKGSAGTHRAITQHERDLIAKCPGRIRAGIMVMLFAGLRRGEMLALNVDRDVDFQAKTLTVREAVRFHNSHFPEIVDPKTEAGARTVPLLDVLADELRGKHGLVCTKEDGEIMTGSAWERAWESYIAALERLENGCQKRWYGRTKEHKALIAAGKELPPWKEITIRPHDLRHSYCTMLYDAGVDLKTAQKWMGHADQQVTMSIYTHLTAERQKSATEALENAAKKLTGVQNGVQ